MLANSKITINLKLTESDLNSLISEFEEIKQAVQKESSTDISLTNLNELLVLFKERLVILKDKDKRKGVELFTTDIPEKEYQYVPSKDDLLKYSIENRKKSKYLVDKFYKAAEAKFVAIAERNREDAISKATPEEKKFKAVLKALNVKYEYQHIIFIDNWHFYIVDFYLPDYNVVVEIDGNFHNIYGHKAKDRKRTDNLKKLAKVKNIIRIANEDVKPNQTFIKKVGALLDKAGLITFNYSYKNNTVEL